MFIKQSEFVPPTGEDYSQCEDMCEPDQSMSLDDLFKSFMSGAPLNVNMYDQYDDSDDMLLSDGTDWFDVANEVNASKDSPDFDSYTKPYT